MIVTNTGRVCCFRQLNHFTCEQAPHFPPGSRSWSDESSSSDTSCDPFPDHDGGSSSEPNCLHTRYACSTSLLTTYNVSSWHQGIHKNRSGPSECGKHDGCIFCRSCESWCVSYQKRKYPWSTHMVIPDSSNSNTTHFLSFSYRSTTSSPVQTTTHHFVTRKTAIVWTNQQLRRSVVSWWSWTVITGLRIRKRRVDRVHSLW